MEKDELLKTISFVLEGIDQMQIPYEQLTTVANWLEALYRYFPEDLDDLNFKNKNSYLHSVAKSRMTI